MSGKDRTILLIDRASAICAAKGGKTCFGICDGCLGEAIAARAEDMAAVGESLMEAIADNQEHTLLKGWAPINDPAEIVADLLNAYDEQAAELADAMRAIEPFARACTISNHEDDDVIDDTLAAGKICFGDMRAARSFFFKTKGTTAVSDDVVRALKAARQFIVNGIECGYIRMPDPATPDSAHDTLPMIEAALSRFERRQDIPA